MESANYDEFSRMHVLIQCSTGRLIFYEATPITMVCHPFLAFCATDSSTANPPLQFPHTDGQTRTVFARTVQRTGNRIALPASPRRPLWPNSTSMKLDDDYSFRVDSGMGIIWKLQRWRLRSWKASRILPHSLTKLVRNDAEIGVSQTSRVCLACCCST